MWNKIKPYMPWTLIEFMFHIVLIGVITHVIYGPKEADTHATTMIAGAAFYTTIYLRRKLDNGEYK